MENLFTILETGPGLDVVRWLQANRTPGLNAVAIALSVVGGFIWYLFLVIPLYWSVDKRLAKRYLFAVIVSELIVTALMLTLQRPRPFIASPDVVALMSEGRFGFPSGHITTMIPTLGVLVAALNRRWLWPLLAVYVALMAWARMYIGVHFPQDVIGGTLIGSTILWFTLRYYDRMAAWWGRVTVPARVVSLFLMSAMIATFLWRDIFDIVIAGTLIGGGIGMMVDTRWLHFSAAGSLVQRGLRLVMGGVVLTPIFAMAIIANRALGRQVATDVFWYAVITFGITAIVPWVAIKLRLAFAETTDISPRETKAVEPKRQEMEMEEMRAP